jgi:hypothetical protein
MGPMWPSTHQCTIDWSDRAVGTTAKHLLLLGARERGGKVGADEGKGLCDGQREPAPISASVGKE